MLYHERMSSRAQTYFGLAPGGKAITEDAPRLIDLPPPGHWSGRDGCGTYDEQGRRIQDGAECDGPGSKSHREREDSGIAELRAHDKVWKTPAADGYAYYYVRSLRPLKLSHIPYLDGYTADPALLRGLNAAELVADIDQDRRVREYIQEREESRR